MSASSFTQCLVCVMMLSACGPADEESNLIAPGEPEVQLGHTADRQFQVFATGDALEVLWGLQGGTWAMPMLRTRGIASPTVVQLTLTHDSGEVLGESVTRQKLEATGGWLQTRIAVPVQHAAPNEFESIGDLYGEPAQLSVLASDEEGRAAESTLELVLTEAP